MRLRQLARKLQVQPKQLIAVLAENGHEIENDPNFKLTETQEELILKTIPAPEGKSVESPEEDVIEAIEVPKAVVEELETPTEEIITPEPIQEEAKPEQPKPIKAEEAPKVYSLEKEEQEKHKDVELIKAPKLKLEGLKVLGKIDLPAPKVKEKEAPEESEEKTEEPRQPRTSQNREINRQDRNREKLRPRPNSLEAERRRAEQEAKRKKLAEEKRLKAIKEKHYKENVQAKIKAGPTKKKKTKPELSVPTNQKTQTAKKPAVKKEAPKKGLRRLWAWLNGELDKH